MKRSTISQNKWIKFAAILFWIAAWHIFSVAVGQKLLVASPLDTLRALGALVQTPEFYATIGRSLGRIGLGFVLAFVAAAFMAAVAARLEWMRILLDPLMRTVRAVPVASFVIIVLMWARSASLSTVIAFLMVWPVMYESILTGLRSRDVRLEEMAQVFRVPALRRFRLITLPLLSPHMRSGVKVSLGLCWKAGVAAEVIGQPQGTIGAELYLAKVFFATPELFAWTICIVLASAVLEKLLLLAYDRAMARIGGRV